MLRTLARWLGYGVLALVLVALVGLVWGAVRVARYEQRDDPDALERKAATLAWMAEHSHAGAARPNVVVILFDDLGFGDLGAFGSRALATPRLDRLAAEGVALDRFYAPMPYCTPSRAGLLTGRWPVRTTLTHVVFPSGSPLDRLERLLGLPVRLPADEITLAEALRGAGYATGMVGKWHLGDHTPSLPNDLGFEHYFGLLHSNDMTPIPLWRNREIVEPHPIDQRTLVPRYDAEAVAFIEANAERPFFLYLAHNFPHIPLHATPEQAGKSAAGLYGDVIADLDRSVGNVLDALERNGLTERTLVFVTSDNGPWFQGSAGGVRGRKNDAFEGGMRVPCLARWPGQLPAGARSAVVATALDLFTTVLARAGVPLPDDRAIDGIDLWPMLAHGAPSPERPIYYYLGPVLQGIRVEHLKAHRRALVPGVIPASWPLMPLVPRGPWLFDLERDPDESYDLSANRRNDLTRLLRFMDTFEADLARNPRGWRQPTTRAPSAR